MRTALFNGFFPGENLPVYLVSLLRRVERFLQVRARCSDTICAFEKESLPSVLIFCHCADLSFQFLFDVPFEHGIGQGVNSGV